LRVFFDWYITDRNVKVRANSSIIKSCIFVKIIRLLLLLLSVLIVGKGVSIGHRVRKVARSWSCASKLLGSSCGVGCTLLHGNLQTLRKFFARRMFRIDGRVMLLGWWCTSPIVLASYEVLHTSHCELCRWFVKATSKSGQFRVSSLNVKLQRW
jgi:hypothetical protein